MAFPESIKSKVYEYCTNHLPDDNWYKEEFSFIEDNSLKKRIIEEFKSIRFAYKLYEGIEATNENHIFEVRHQIFVYASIYEAIIHYILYNYYKDTDEVRKLQYHTVPTRLSFSEQQMVNVKKILNRANEDIFIYHMQERKKEQSQIRFDDKCYTAAKLGLINSFKNNNGETIDLPSEIIQIYEYRNAIHLVAEQRKKVAYELTLSKKAYKRMQPFLSQVKEGLRRDHKGIYS